MLARSPTKAEAEYMANCKQIGCIVSILNFGHKPFDCPPEYVATHHIRGAKAEGAHFYTIPIFPHFHQSGPDALHKNLARFENKFGSQFELLAATRKLYEAAFHSRPWEEMGKDI